MVVGQLGPRCEWDPPEPWSSTARPKGLNDVNFNPPLELLEGALPCRAERVNGFGGDLTGCESN